MAAASTRRCPSSAPGAGSRRGKRWRCTCGNDSRHSCRAGSRCTRCACRRGRISIRNISVKPEPLTPDPLPDLTPRPPLPSGEGEFRSSALSGTERGSGGEDSGSVKPHLPGSRRGRMLADSAVVEEWPVWLEVNGEPAVTWMCTPDQLEELATGWLHGEGYIETLDDLVKLRPCATDLGFWAEVKPERVALVQGDDRRRGSRTTAARWPGAAGDGSDLSRARVQGGARRAGLCRDAERAVDPGAHHCAALRHGAGRAGGERNPAHPSAGRMTPEALGALLREAKTIAVVGLSPKPWRPSHQVARYLQRAGYRIVPVNPGHDAVLGERSYPSLTAAAAAHSIDVVDVFRRGELAGPIVDEAIALKPRLIWLQVGVVDAAAAARAAAAGIPCVMDRCLMVDHQQLLEV